MSELRFLLIINLVLFALNTGMYAFGLMSLRALKELYATYKRLTDDAR